MSFFARLRAALSRFMLGRYGLDSLGQAILFFWFLIAAFNLIFRSLYLYLFGLLLCFFFFFRFLSKNHIKRRKENADWYRISTSLKQKYQHISVRFRERKTTRFFRCPFCRAPIRMPRKIGKFNIRCPKCGGEFQKEFKN